MRLFMLALVAASMLIGANQTAAQEFERDVIATSAGDLEMTFIGHGTLMFRFGGKVIHIDPVSNEADYSKLPKADLILVTHEHGDHLDAKAISAVTKDGTTLILTKQCSAQLKNPVGSVVMANGETRTEQGLVIEAVPAYNIEKTFHPKGNGNGYIITFGNKRVYVAGDTENTPEMKALKNIAVAFLPMNLPYTMTPEQVADAAKAFRPAIVYPYHYGNTDTSQLVKLLAGEKGIEVRIRKLD
jgi:L-ascorbate metabolism protein UlaG (beta-lactamase superfamily)